MRRLIPAHAGKTVFEYVAGGGQWAHPRACGENASAKVTMSLSEGSSPRMRGKPSQAWVTLFRNGLIPAHAGKTRATQPAASASRAHPRACGENLLPFGSRSLLPGSSPRMRGKRSWHRIFVALRRLIPAHAGKTISLDFLRKNSGAHPRACGENSVGFDSHPPDQGSSPRMRGKRNSSTMNSSTKGLIPAHAGKT